MTEALRLYLLDIRPYAGIPPSRLGRRLLDQALGENASARLCFGTQGKPLLPGGPCFNLSHSGDYLLLAVSPLPVGVDIERRRAVDYHRLAKRCFHPAEQEALRRAADVQAVFFDIWACRESCLKAVGCGLTLPPHSFRVSLEGGSSASLAQTGDAFPAAHAAFRIHRFPALEGYSAALCAAPSLARPALTHIQFNDIEA